MEQHKAWEVARELRARKPGMTRWQLHKLMYYCQAQHLAAFGEPLFPEKIVAWDNGPVVSQLWGMEQKDPTWEPPAGHPGLSGDEAALNTVGYVLARYGHLSGDELVRLTHSERPWLEANSRRGGVARSAEISTETIRETVLAAQLAENADEPQPDADQLAALMTGAAERASVPAPRDDREALLARLR